MAFKLRSKIFLALLISLMAAGLSYYFVLQPWVAQQSRARVQEDLKAALNLALQIANAHQGDNWQELAENLSGISGCRVSIISAGGQVLADSMLRQNDFARAENHGARSEIAEALNVGFGLSQRHSSSLETSMIYVAKPLKNHQAVLRLALPAKSAEFTGLPWPGLLLAGVLLVALAFALAHWLAKGQGRFFNEVENSLRSLKDGVCAFPWRAGRYEANAWHLGRALEETAIEVKGTIDALSQDAMRLRSILQGLAEPVFSVDADGKISRANQAALKLLGTKALGQGVGVSIRSAGLISALGQASVEKKPVREEIRTQGGQIWQAVCSPLPGPDSAAAEVVVILHNITQMQKLSAMRRDFVANFSHELRTPLAVIKGAQETLSSLHASEEDSRRFLEAIARQVARLQNLLDDLLELAHLESPEWQDKDQERIGLKRLLQGAMLAIDVAAAAARVDIVCETPRQGLTVFGQYNTLERALINLLDNAVKYSAPGGQVCLRAWAENNKVLIEVRDNGPGIGPEHLERIFERFYRVDKSRGQESTGLGLSIVRHALKLHGGEVLVQSKLNQGSTFTMVLPEA